MTDRIALRGLRVRGHHGVHEHERRDGQYFLVDLVLDVDLRPAGTSDELADTVDYAAVADKVAAVVAGQPVALLERLAELVAATCLADPRVTRVEVGLRKPDVLLSAPVEEVGITVVRP